MVKNLPLLSGLLITVGCLMFPANSQAVLLAYEGFESYEPGPVNGDNGGQGWGGAWVASTSPVYANVVADANLSFSGGSITVNGSGQALGLTGGGDGALNRSFTNPGGGSEIYFSFLFRPVSLSGDEFFNFYLSDDANRFNSGGIGDYFTASGSAAFGARSYDDTTATTSSSGVTYSAGTTYLLVGRLSTDGSTGPEGIIDRVELWVNPTSLVPGAADATVNASTGLAMADFDFFSSRLVNFSAPDQIQIDELKIGTDFASVVSPVPEPGAGLLVALGGMALVGLRRRPR